MDRLAVFLVDDEPDFHIVFRTLLSRAGLDVLDTASDPHDGLVAWRALGSVPDLVVTDYRMPAMTGIELAARMLAEVPQQCIVLLTAERVERSLRHSAADAGIASVLGKNDLSLLPAALRHCYQERGPALRER